jgi:hypothetical protein
MKKLSGVVLAVLSGLLFQGSAHAAIVDTYWSSPAHGCVPEGQTIAANLHEASGGALRFKSGATGTIKFYCPIPPNPSASNPDYMFMTFLDENSTTETGGLNFYFYRQTRADGGIFQIDTFDTYLNEGSAQENFSPFTHTMNHDLYYYYVKVVMTRTASGSGDDVVFYGAGLANYD